MIAQIGGHRRRNRFHDTATAVILQEAECWRWDLSELDADTEADPDSWKYPAQCRAFILAVIEDANEELARRDRLRHRPGAPAWPERWPDRRAELAAIKAAIDLPRFVERMCQTPLARRGRQLVGRCPLPGHDDRTPSFVVHPEKGVFYCHGCHRGGDIYSLAMHMMRTDHFGDVVGALAIEAGITRSGRESAHVG